MDTDQAAPSPPLKKPTRKEKEKKRNALLVLLVANQ
jgi:hypothetical protein